MPVGRDETVEFLIHRSLIDDSPAIVKLELGSFWIRARPLQPFQLRKEILALEQNPHFYERLPTRPEKYRGNFRMNPIKIVRDQKTISVLTDNPDHAGQVFVDIARRNLKRAFGNVYVLNDTIIFKDVRGRLEGEDILGAAIHCIPNLWCFEESLSESVFYLSAGAFT
ncbi:hypothetical protein BJV77DRAFT_1064461 [Russula vinacea]|nr:hypothetical protein BJV77DRAFT_1064461 [Russula vinacea]